MRGLSKEAEIALGDGSPTKSATVDLGERGWLTPVGCSGLDLPPTNPRRNDPRLEIGLELQLLESAENALKYSQSAPSKVGLRMLNLTADLRLNRAADVGIGFGRAWFRSTGGTEFDSFHKAVWQPLRVTVRPLSFLSQKNRATEALSLHFDATQFLGTFTDQQFGADANTYKEPGEITWSWSVRVDPFALLK
jgi:hypothetical protein